MNNQTQDKTTPPVRPSRMLHTMIRVGDLERALAFYVDGLGMHVQRREDFSEGRFTLVFVGYGDEASTAVIELTHNWDTKQYSHGTGYGHIAIGVPDIQTACDRLATLGVNILRDPGPMAFSAEQKISHDVIAFVEDPDGYHIELIEN